MFSPLRLCAPGGARASSPGWLRARFEWIAGSFPVACVMVVEWLMLLAGLVLIVNGGGWFVAAAVRLAEFLRIPRVVVGSTLVSLATTTPELVVSIMASLHGEPGLAAGNAIGSCICNLGLILGITAALKFVDVQWRAIRTPLYAMCALGVLLFALTLDLSLSRGEGVLLLLVGAGYFAWDFWQHWRDRNPAHVIEAVAIEAETAITRWRWFETQTGSVVQFVLGTAVVVGGSRMLVEGAVGCAARMGVPPIVVGLTVVAVGTSLPELVTAITSSRKAVADLAVGNVLGANVANLSLIVGAAAVIQDVTLEPLTQRFNFPALLVLFALTWWMLRSGNRLTRLEGAILLGVYAIYLAAVVVLEVPAGE